MKVSFLYGKLGGTKMQNVMNMIQTENILLVTPLEWNMILNKEKWVVFQNEISEKLKKKLMIIFLINKRLV